MFYQVTEIKADSLGSFTKNSWRFVSSKDVSFSYWRLLIVGFCRIFRVLSHVKEYWSRREKYILCNSFFPQIRLIFLSSLLLVSFIYSLLFCTDYVRIHSFPASRIGCCFPLEFLEYDSKGKSKCFIPQHLLETTQPMAQNYY